jgi:hypothetical protein
LGLRLALLAPAAGLASALAMVGGQGAAVAATTLPTPESLTNCGGQLSADATGAAQGQPNLLDYYFNCNTPISAYTITVDRRMVVEPGGATSTTESITCEGTTPANGINCNLGAGGLMDAYAAAQGSIDLVDAYCAHLPSAPKPGTAAIPQAIVSVVVTDNTGAEDGPFYLPLNAKCPKVPAVAPAPAAKTKKKSKKK